MNWHRRFRTDVQRQFNRMPSAVGLAVRRISSCASAKSPRHSRTPITPHKSAWRLESSDPATWRIGVAIRRLWGLIVCLGS